MEINVQVHLKDVFLRHLTRLVTKFFGITDFISSPRKVRRPESWLNVANDSFIKIMFEIHEVFCVGLQVSLNRVHLEASRPRWRSHVVIRRVFESLEGEKICALQDIVVLSLIEWIWLSETEIENEHSETDNQER